ncbi:hypothetical protein AX16_002956 [Volvariella volvacea WC 439]|nr:hypothetical protein AX16_002956 [Volvariella volvacea WC 439]
MFSKLSVLASLALVPFVAAQGGGNAADNVALELEAIKAHFEQSHLVPDLLEEFDPVALLTLNYEGVGDITPGQALTNEQVGPTPVITITAPEGSDLEGNYTIAMVDAGPVGSDISAGVTRHWLVNSVTVDGTSLNEDAAVAITTYAGPFPPEGDGPHRYAILLYTQPESFSPPEEFAQPDIGVSVFDVHAYARDSGLGPIVAGTYITVERGELASSLPETTAVDTATLSAPSPSGSASGSSSGSGSGSGNAPEATDAADSDNGASALSAGPFLALASVVMMLVA